MIAEGPDKVDDGVTDAVEEVTAVIEAAEVAVFETEDVAEVEDKVTPAL